MRLLKFELVILKGVKKIAENDRDMLDDLSTPLVDDFECVHCIEGLSVLSEIILR